MSSRSAWPRFEPAMFANLDSLSPALRDAFQKAGVPKNFFGKRYSARPLLEPIDVPGRGTLIRFGDLGLWGSIYADPATDEAIEEYPPTVPRLANSSLIQFSRTTKALIELFPYYDDGADLDEREAAAKRLRQVIRSVDQAAVDDPDSFWSTFLDDVSIGDFSPGQFASP
jgi:hypothetical protein